MGGVIAHAPAHQPHQRLHRRHILQPQLLLGFADPRIHMLQHLLIELFFAF